MFKSRFSKRNIGETMPKAKTGWVKTSGYLFLLGIIISIIAGIFMDAISITYVQPIHTILIILGAVIGLLGAAGVGSIDRTDIQIFLLAVVALIGVGGAGAALVEIPIIGIYLKSIVDYIATLVVPAAVIIALEAIWRTGSTKF
jgi:hypothetical protein